MRPWIDFKLHYQCTKLVKDDSFINKINNMNISEKYKKTHNRFPILPGIFLALSVWPGFFLNLDKCWLFLSSTFLGFVPTWPHPLFFIFYKLHHNYKLHDILHNHYKMWCNWQIFANMGVVILDHVVQGQGSVSHHFSHSSILWQCDGFPWLMC